MSLDYLMNEIRALKARVSALETIDSVPVVAFATLTSNQTISNNTVDVVDFDDIEIDTYNACDTSGDFRFTAPVGGWYIIGVKTRFAGDTDWAIGELAQVRLHVGGTLNKVIDDSRNISASAAESLGRSILVQLSKDQYIEIAVLQQSGDFADIEGDASGLITWVHIHRIRGY